MAEDNQPPLTSSLATLQSWMQAVLMHPGGVQEGVRSPAAHAHLAVDVEDIEEVVGRSRALTAVERLEIYNRAYFARLLECLRADYTVLAAVLGENLFDRFAIGYLLAYPSRSYTLNRLGADFPQYLRETRPQLPDANERGRTSLPGEPAAEDWPALMIELAVLERTIQEVFDGAGNEHEPPFERERLDAVAPEARAEIRLACVPCLRLLAFQYPVNDVYTAVRHGRPFEIPPARDTFLAITRRNYIVRRHEMDAVQFALLQQLLQGQTLGAAIATAAEFIPDERLAQFPHDLSRWFQEWTTAGFFADVVVAEAAG